MICYACPRSTNHLRWRCKACRGDFSITWGTLFAWHKLPLRTYLLAVVAFCNEVKGKSMVAFSRELDVQYKSSFVLAHKLREAMASSVKARHRRRRTGGRDRRRLFRRPRPAGDLAADRVDRRLAENQSDKRQVVVVMREREERTLVKVVPSEEAAVPVIRQRIAKGTVLHADESPAWNKLHAGFAMRRINHQVGYSIDAPRCADQGELLASSRVFAAGSWGITTISPAGISAAMPRKQAGERTTAASATASRCTALFAWRCGASHRSISAATGNAHAPPDAPATRPRLRSRSVRSFPWLD